MKFIKCAFILLPVTLFIVACAETQTTDTNSFANSNVVANAPAPRAETPDEIAAAKTIYMEACVGCHREKGEGGAAEFEGRKIKL